MLPCERPEQTLIADEKTQSSVQMATTEQEAMTAAVPQRGQEAVTCLSL